MFPISNHKTPKMADKKNSKKVADLWLFDAASKSSGLFGPSIFRPVGYLARWPGFAHYC